MAAKASSSQDSKPRSKRFGPNGLPLCAACGEREVPPEEWPADPLYPKACDPCLRKNAWGRLSAPQTPREQPAGPETPAPPRQAEESADEDFGEMSSDFGE